jgi:hypothetical protein
VRKSIDKLFLLALIPVLVQPVSATTVVPPTFNELVSQAEVIVQAEVTAKRCEFTPVGDGNVIHTYVTLTVLKQIKGVSPATIELRLLGGEIGNEGMMVEGVPEFEVGDRDVLFIENNGSQYCPLVAVMHGRYPVVTQNGAEVVLRSNGEPLTSPDQVQTALGHGGSADVLSAGFTGPAMTLARFENEILEELSHAQNK